MAVKSNSNAAKRIIRREISTYYHPHEYGVRSVVQAVKKDADAYNCGDSSGRRRYTDYQKGASLVDGGALACYYSDQAEMLGKIYGKAKVAKWNGEKIHATYRHLIGREYDSMLREQRAKAAKKPAAKKPTKKGGRK